MRFNIKIFDTERQKEIILEFDDPKIINPLEFAIMHVAAQNFKLKKEGKSQLSFRGIEDEVTILSKESIKKTLRDSDINVSAKKSGVVPHNVSNPQKKLVVEQIRDKSEKNQDVSILPPLIVKDLPKSKPSDFVFSKVKKENTEDSKGYLGLEPGNLITFGLGKLHYFISEDANGLYLISAQTETGKDRILRILNGEDVKVSDDDIKLHDFLKHAVPIKIEKTLTKKFIKSL